MASKSRPDASLLCSGHSRPVVHFEFSQQLPSDGSYQLISACKDSTAQLREGKTGDWSGTFIGHKGAVWQARLDRAEATRAVTGSADFSAKVWDAITGAELANLPHEHIVRAVDISPSGDFVVTGGHEKRLRVWRVETQTEQRFPLAGLPNDTSDESTIKFVSWDDDRAQVVSAGANTVRWWDLRSRRCTHSVPFADPIASVERSNDGSLLAIAVGKRVVFLDAATHTPTIEHTLPYAPSSTALHPTMRDRFVTGAINDGWVRIHSADDGSELELYKGHHGPVHCVQYSPDGELYASGSEDGTIRLRQTAPKTFGLFKWTGDEPQVSQPPPSAFQQPFGIAH